MKCNSEATESNNHTERHKSLCIHTRNFVCLNLYSNFILNDSMAEYAVHHDALYNTAQRVERGI